MTTETTPAPVTEATDAAAAATTAPAVDPSNVPDAAAAAVAADPVAATAPVVDAAHGAAHHAPALAEIFNGIGVNVVYLMGFSFILGSLFTVLILVLLDYLRRNKA